MTFSFTVSANVMLRWGFRAATVPITRRNAKIHRCVLALLTVVFLYNSRKGYLNFTIFSVKQKKALYKGVFKSFQLFHMVFELGKIGVQSLYLLIKIPYLVL